MSWPTKILPFKRPAHPALQILLFDAAAFPRFRLEWNRPTPPTKPHPVGPTPSSGK